MGVTGNDGAAIGPLLGEQEVREILARRAALCRALLGDMVGYTVEELDKGSPEEDLVAALLDVNSQQDPDKLAEVLAYCLVELAKASRVARP